MRLVEYLNSKFIILNSNTMNIQQVFKISTKKLGKKILDVGHLTIDKVL